MGALPGHTRPSRLLGAALSIGLLASPAALLTTSSAVAEAAAETPTPSIRLFSSNDRVIEYTRPAGRRAWLPVPVWATPTGEGAFDLRVRRPNFATAITATQLVHHADGSTTQVARPDLPIDGWRGLPGFFDLTVTNGAGQVVKRASQRYCPNAGQQQRLDPAGPDTATFPEGCGGMPFTYGTRWGIDDGWANGVGEGLVLNVPAGRYTATIRVTEAYRSALGIAPADATATVRYRLVDGPYGEHARAANRTSDEPAPVQARASAPIVTQPDAAYLPDLRSLPAFGMETSRQGGKDWLSFGANVWIGGNSLLDIEGFRRQDEEVMDAWQYFYDGDEPVGRAPVGTMEYDTRDGHFHWHLQQFARYRLLTQDKQRVVVSSKQSFCIVPTDPVDLSLANAEMRPYATGLDSACGERDALWIRETLPVGWGDTYYQGKGGQAFDITGVPNGTYLVAVEANPERTLFETNRANNASYRTVILKGRPGARKVCVPALHGIDAHGTC
ncbi:hypothetical protein G7072_10795 [Nocardioides sp. HDW12B]|uniref:lysyl oxidase family protein n=1 Tax=Nocardioides sp. HDW12B TaxID=2714939 RepID=UPI00140DAD37|nr:lysyl oxidase family protein [Nocardioides sp. HDW12B]QIK66761.1 hypothetical protein G7072_10795 [Nocardioides sp. HDW12B]